MSMQFAVQTFPLSPGQDTVRTEITSNATGSTILGSCEYMLTILASDSDTDGDALFDSWEIAGGLDVDLDGIADVLLPGSTFMRKDIYLELDCIVASDHTHCPTQNAVQDIVKSFADAPVPNPDGTTGIQLHVDTGTLYGGGVIGVFGNGGVTGTYGDLGGGGDAIAEAGNEVIDWDGAAGDPATDYYDLKAANFQEARMFVYRYGLFGHQTNARRSANDCTSGWAEGIPGDDFFVTFGGTGTSGGDCWSTDTNGFSVGSRAEKAGTLQHEFGHVLGLGHGGGDGVNRKPNYLSVMNYAFQMCGVPTDPGGVVPGGCDFSPIKLSDLDEMNLDECAGVGLGFGPMDWDGDGDVEGVSNCQPPNNMNVIAEINSDDRCVDDGDDGTLESTPAVDDMIASNRVVDGANFTCDTTADPLDVQLRSVGHVQPLLEGFDDWSNIFYEFRTLSTFPMGISDPVQDEVDPEVLEDARQVISDQLEPKLVVSKTGSATAVPDEVVEFTITVRNEGKGPALEIVLVDTLPDTSVVEFPIGKLEVGDETTVMASYTIPGDACPSTITNTVSAQHKDFVAKAMEVTDFADVMILDVAPPELSLSLMPDVLWPPSHELVPIEASIVVTDNCDPNPQVRLVSVTSSESDNGRGDGNTVNDIQDADLGSDDRSILLRAERSGRGNGRTYTIVYEAEDASGNTTIEEAIVVVPKRRP